MCANSLAIPAKLYVIQSVRNNCLLLDKLMTTYVSNPMTQVGTAMTQVGIQFT